ncbi:murein DD-endopeptidase MepM/ murein hydrolase activator NlpD [Streptomyces sp. 846.5]|nr:M23 family metallopeptidase [Streptomyces sp. 846.5]TDU04962.1 murein DD-endopeptidase MepM/ murein hydrolase activator NlpD [Streptomyces sp. 846.5]
MASNSPAWAPVQPIPPQRSAPAVLGFAAMAAVGATGAVALAAPSASAAVRETGGSTLVAQEQAHGATATLTRPTGDPGTALADRIRTQATQQRATVEDTARRQAAVEAEARKTAAREAAAREAAAREAAAYQAAERARAVEQAAQEAATQAVAEAARQAAAAQAAAQAAVAQAQNAAGGVGTLVTPIATAVAGSGFGQSDSLWSQLHTGQDFTAPTGTPVAAVGNGTITSAGWAGAYGYRVVETLADGTEVWYCHLSVIGVGSGEVTAGQLIGRVGATGSNVNAPHLHLEVRPGGGEPVDPALWLSQHGLAL